MLQGKEGTLRETMEMLVARPMDCVNAIEAGGEVTYIFWASLCSLIKTDIRKKNERLPSDVAFMEAAYIIETCLNLYKTRLQQERVKETALRNLDQQMDKAPYYFTQDQIIKFTDSKGVVLLSQYTEGDLNNYIRKKTTESPEGGIPEWLVVQSRRGEQYYLKTDKYLPLVTRLIIEGQGAVKQEIASRWIALLNDFKSEPAMENDGEFERLIATLNASMNPLLNTFLEDKKLLWVYDELERTQKVIPPASRIFDRGKLIPYSLLFLMKRKEMLFDAKMSLPFWYSIPIIRSIIAYFSRFGKKKKRNRPNATKADVDIDFSEEEAAAGAARDHNREFINSIREAEAELVPADKNIDAYIRELQNHWGRLLDPQAQQNLVEDVNALIRDNLRQSVRLWKRQRLTRESMEELAEGIINGTPSLRNLKTRDILLLYMQVYMIKLLKNIRV
jgi:hypothetical protein